MYKTGICNAEDWKRRSRLRRAIAYRLLDARYWPPEGGVDIFEHIVRDLELASGVCRTTYRGRLKDVDAATTPILTERFAGMPAFEVYDWAASDCLASAEWAEALFAIMPGCRFIASDIALHLVEVSRGGHTIYVFEPGGAALQYVRPPFVIDFKRTPARVYIVNRLLRRWARRELEAARSVATACRWAQMEDERVLEFPPWRAAKLPLVHPDARAFRNRAPRFSISVHSVFEPLPAACHAIRTMNIFNRIYFPEAELRKGLCCVADSLVTGGVWVVGRTVRETTHPHHEVSIFEKTVRGFALLRRLNGGSEMEGVVRDAGFWAG